MMIPKKVKAVNEISVEEYRAMVNSNPLMIPKKSKLQPSKSKTMRAECSEDQLQGYANEAIELRRWDYIRFHNGLLSWMKLNAPPWIQKLFFSQVGGKLPDNFVLVQVAPGMFLAVKLELKTQDKKGRAVGRLHGKQKNYAEKEEWFIARSPEQINVVLDKIEVSAQKVKKVLTLQID